MTTKNNSDLEPENESKRNVTLRDIAKELSVSHVTVSLALRDHPRISEATRKRVKAKADEMGYHPDPMLSALSHYRLTSKEKPVQATLALINPLKNPEKFRQQEEFSRYWKGAVATAERLGFHIEEFRTTEIPLKRMDTIFKTRSIRGLLIAPLSYEVTPLNWDDMPWQDYAAVRFGRSLEGPPLHFVTSAQVSNTLAAFIKIQEMGYKRIGFFGWASPRRMFVAGYLRAQQNIPDSERLAPMRYENNARHALKESLSTWLEQTKPDAIITDQELLPSLINELGYSIPKDISIATLSVHDTPIDSGINQNPEEIGRAAVRMLVSLMNEHHFGIPNIRNQILVEGQWIDGSMLPPKI